MQTQQHSLVLCRKQEADTVNKQCKMCGKVVTFTDTTIRRHNANGKYIYQFAIYKCPKNHSWNKKLGIYKSFSEHVDPESIVPTEFETVPENKKISISLDDNIYEWIEITISEVDGHFRLDRTLSDQIEGISRSAISQKIKAGTILLNNCLTKPSQRLSLHDKITIKVN
ncbi:cytoplasmic protein [Fictibacillus barbaricus]|uniref:Cytoplasmic protein n=1 Tax=Fictibacillus barbaricus TaxID=182136 RepID=A0ABU1U0S1_9BACL|nr:cytoplasmic protein [Fictibacillus barbaricus]MDR7073068.1 hypothetical protein [Fictibacillus barbaricus]